jgi:Tfp pilus assembly protein PilF
MSERQQQAWSLLQEAYRVQMGGDYDRAVELYKNSLDLFPTAEAHTFLGWTYHFQGKTDQAISECKRAIEVDPDFGNPYNDIGSYLIQQGKYDESIPWLQRALTAPRYEPRHFPHFNLGRAYIAKANFTKAREHFNEALRIEPNYALARQAIENLRRLVN